MEEHHLNINILSVFVEEIFEEMWDWLVSDVSAHDHMPEDEGSYHQKLSLRILLHALLGDKIYKMVRLYNQTFMGIV